MPLFDLICLANSNKMRGRCVAGLRVDGNGWIRPIAPDTDHGQLFSNHFQLDDGSEPKVLDLIRLNLAGAQPVPGQPENWVVGKERWILRARPLGPDLYPLLRNAIATGPVLLGSTQARISAVDAVQLASSLALIKPSKLQWHLKRDLYDRLQPRLCFALDGQNYDLPVTDPAWTSRIMRKLSQAEPGFYPQEKLGFSKDSPILLTVSLGEAFKGYCYKLAAAIVELPGFKP
jgi:hypothetical protein